MTDHKKFKNESQDARRHDQHNETHPDEKLNHSQDKFDRNQAKESHPKSDKRK